MAFALGALVVLSFAIFSGYLAVKKSNNLSVTEKMRFFKSVQYYLAENELKRQLAGFLYPFGISLNPKNVVIGYDGWMHLGEQHENTISVHRDGGFCLESEKVAGWVDYFGLGAESSLFVVAPNKSTVYPDTMPLWARQNRGCRDEEKNALNLGAYLASEARESDIPLYYKTDTHWNAYGSALAYVRVMESLSNLHGGLRHHRTSELVRGKLVPRSYVGDLQRMAFVNFDEPEQELSVRFNTGKRMHSTVVDTQTQSILYEGNVRHYEHGLKPLLVSTPAALNSKRLVWIGDSFSFSLSKHIFETFSEVLIVHRRSEHVKDGAAIRRLIENHSPDMVMVMMVERDYMAPGVFYNQPPASIN